MTRSLLALTVSIVAASFACAQGEKGKPAPPAGRGPLTVTAMQEAREVVEPRSNARLLCVAPIPGTAKAYAGGTNGKIILLDFDDLKSKPNVWTAHEGYVSGLALAGKVLVSAGSDHKLIWWNAETKEKIRELVAHDKKWIRGVAASPDGRWVASVGDDMVARVWNVDTGKIVHELNGHEKLTPYGLGSKLYCVRFSADGKLLATGDQTGTALIWDAATGKQLGKVRAAHLYAADASGHTYGGCRALAFSPDGSLLALAGNVGKEIATINGNALVQVFDWKSEKMTHDLPAQFSCFIESLQFHPKEPWLFAGCGAGQGEKVVLFDLNKKAIVQEFPTRANIFDIALSESAGALVAVGRTVAYRWQLSK